MEDKICLDTDFLINFLRNKSEEVEFIKNNEDKELATTLVNIFELYYGAYKSKSKTQNLKSVSLLLERLEILNFSLESAKKSGEILVELEKKGETIDYRDIFIGVITLNNGYSIKTNNTKHFEKIGGLRICSVNKDENAESEN